MLPGLSGKSRCPGLYAASAPYIRSVPIQTTGVAGSFPTGLGSTPPHPVPLGFVFRSRAKDEKAQSAVSAQVTDSNQPRDPQAPKGRPTPKRSVAQSQRRSVANTPMTRKDAAKRQREERRTAMARQHEDDQIGRAHV